MTDYSKPFPCGECKKMVMIKEKHIFEDCTREKLVLPLKLTEESYDVVGKVFFRMGSIKKCKDVFDFGKYRFALIEEFDKKIREIINKGVK